MKYLIAAWSLYPIDFPGVFLFVPKWFASLHQNSSIDQICQNQAEQNIPSPSKVMCPMQWLQFCLVLYLLFLPFEDILACHSSNKES